MRGGGSDGHHLGRRRLHLARRICLTGSLVEEGVVNLYRQLLGAEPAGFLGARGSGDATTGQDAAPSRRPG